MPILELSNGRLFFQIEGKANAPVLIFSNSLGTDHQMWDEQVEILKQYFKIVRYDTRGHGQSGVSDGEYNLDLLGGDVLALADSLGIEKFSFCGLSMGGLIGQWLGVNHSDRLEKLIICNTAAKIGNADHWEQRISHVLANGTSSIWEATLERWFTPNFRNNDSQIAPVKQAFIGCSAVGYTNCCATIRDADFREQLGKIDVPTLVITGSQDPVTNVEQASYLATHIPDASLVILQAAHLSNVEQGNRFTEVLLAFLPKTQLNVFEDGMKVRRAVLGNTHVDRATANINNFNADFQSFITKYAWGEIWTRGTLARHERSLITLAMLIALNREDEFKMHVRAAFNNGVTVSEIKELIMQSGIYCGLPAANQAFHAAQEVFDTNEIKYK
jgi:3-oxoadipate enol-lactonase / 4-carboxymuconolactone decarboxylase